MATQTQKQTKPAMPPAREMTDGVRLQIINETPKFKKLWLQLTIDERRRAVRESPDLWHFDEVLQDIIDEKKAVK